MFTPRMRILTPALLLILLGAPAARADYYASQTFDLNQSNKLADDVSYGSVKIEAYDVAGGTKGEVKITYTANPITGALGFSGFHDVAFNTDLDLKAAQIQRPKFWSRDPIETVSGFGTFTWAVEGPLLAVLPTVSLVIKDLTLEQASLNHFLISSVADGPSDTPVVFAGHLAALGVNQAGAEFDLHWVGGGVPAPTGEGEMNDAPEPSTLALAAFGLGGALGLRVVRRGRRPMPVTA